MFAVLPHIALLGTVTIAALVATASPAVLGSSVLFTSIILGSGKSGRRVSLFYIVYGIFLFAFSTLLGTGAFYLFTALPVVWTDYLQLLLGLCAVVLGLVVIKLYFWPRKTTSRGLEASLSKKLRTYAQRLSGPLTVVVLGLLASAFSLLCVLPSYLVVVALVQTTDLTAPFGLVALYSVLILLPFLTVGMLLVGGTKVTTIQKWKEAHKSTLHLFGGLLLIALGWLLLLTLNGAINLG